MNKPVETEKTIDCEIEREDAIKETTYLNSIPGMAKSIIDAGNTAINDCVPEKDMDW